VIHLGSRTDIGRLRERNEDAVGTLRIATTAGDPVDLLVVADGMGGTAGGSTAALLAVERVGERLAALSAMFTAPTDEWQREVNGWLVDAIAEANGAVRQLAFDQPTLAGMGSTLIVGVIVNGWLGLAWVGDSRVYLRRGHQFVQLTVDHTWESEERRRGALTAEDIAASPYRGMVTRGIGLGADIMPETRWTSLQAGDRLLLTTDGLTRYADGPVLAQQLDRCPEAVIAAEYLVNVANANGGEDNTSVIVVDIADPGTGSLPVPRPVTEINAPLMMWDVPAPPRAAPPPPAPDPARRRRPAAPVRRPRIPVAVASVAVVVVAAAGLWISGVLGSSNASPGDVPRSGRIAAARLDPLDTLVAVGSQLTFRFVATDSLLDTLTTTDIVWTSSDSLAASAGPDGRITVRRAADSVLITAQLDGWRRTSVLRIGAGGPSPAPSARDSLPSTRPDR
jgi:PPM family protein phosphatase